MSRDPSFIDDSDNSSPHPTITKIFQSHIPHIQELESKYKVPPSSDEKVIRLCTQYTMQYNTKTSESESGDVAEEADAWRSHVERHLAEGPYLISHIYATIHNNGLWISLCVYMYPRPIPSKL
jgi:hypothetical protein